MNNKLTLRHKKAPNPRIRGQSNDCTVFEKPCFIKLVATKLFKFHNKLVLKLLRMFRRWLRGIFMLIVPTKLHLKICYLFFIYLVILK